MKIKMIVVLSIAVVAASIYFVFLTPIARYKCALNHSMAINEWEGERVAMISAFASLPRSEQYRILKGVKLKYAIGCEIIVDESMIIPSQVSDWKSDKTVNRVVILYRYNHPASTISDQDLIEIIQSTEFFRINERLAEIYVHAKDYALAASIANTFAEYLEQHDRKIKMGRPAISSGDKLRWYNLPFSTCAECGVSARFANKCKKCGTSILKWSEIK